MLLFQLAACLCSVRFPRDPFLIKSLSLSCILKLTTLIGLKLIWNKSIPPLSLQCFGEQSLKGFPLMIICGKREMHIVSVCVNCGHNYETIELLFLRYPFAHQVQDWLAFMLNCFFDFSSITNLLAIYLSNISPQIVDMILVVVNFSFFFT